MSRKADTAPPRRSDAHGFTLVEVLVAVAIVAVSLAAGSRAAGALLDNAQRLSDVTAAQWCADNQLTGLKLAKRFPDIGETQAECKQQGRAYASAQRVQATPNPNFRRVDVAVSDDAGHTLISLSTVLPRY
jgi:general secretion pathway protein I